MAAASSWVLPVFFLRAKFSASITNPFATFETGIEVATQPREKTRAEH